MASIRPKGGPVARRRKHHRRRRHSFSANPRRHRRRSYRRNPSFGVGGIGRAVVKGAKCGAFVTLGEAASVAVPGIVKLPTAGLLGYAARLAAGTILGVVGKGVLGAENAEYFIAGAFAGVYRQLVRTLNVPILAPALAGYPGPVQLRGYARAPLAPTGLRTGTTPDHIRTAGQLF